jgi:hypothetical protein
MEDKWIPKKTLTYNPKRRQNVGCPQISIHFKRTEQTTSGLINDDDDDDDDDELMLEICHYAVKFKLYYILETGPATYA